MEFNADTNKLTLTNIGEAQTFKILSGGVTIYDGPAEIVDGNALITLSTGVLMRRESIDLQLLQKKMQQDSTLNQT